MIELQNLKKIRQSLDLTQHQFAKTAGVSQSLIAKIESGKIDPCYSKIKKIEDAISLLSSKTEIRIEEIMTQKVITISQDAKAIDAIKLMNLKNISQIPVLEGHEIVGLLSESSALEHLEQIKQALVKEIMDEVPPVVSSTARIGVVSSLLHHYPIVLIKKKGVLAGVITKSDLLKKAIV